MLIWSDVLGVSGRVRGGTFSCVGAARPLWYQMCRVKGFRETGGVIGKQGHGVSCGSQGSAEDDAPCVTSRPIERACVSRREICPTTQIMTCYRAGSVSTQNSYDTRVLLFSTNKKQNKNTGKRKRRRNGPQYQWLHHMVSVSAPLCANNNKSYSCCFTSSLDILLVTARQVET